MSRLTITGLKVLPVAILLSALLADDAVCAEPASQFFVVASIGNSDTDYSSTPVDWIDDEDRSFEVGVGYVLSRHFSIQGGYHDFGQTLGVSGCPPRAICFVAPTLADVNIDGWSVTVAGSQSLSGRFAVFARIGVIAWDASAAVTLLSPSSSGEALNDSGEDLIYGAGLRWLLSDRWSAELSYEEINLDIRSSKLGATFHF